MTKLSHCFSFITTCIKETTNIAEAFANAVLKTRPSSTSKPIIIGLIGEPDSGKSSFSEVFISKAPPVRASPSQDKYGQFDYNTEEGLRVCRSDLQAIQTCSDLGTEAKPPKVLHGIHLIEHSDLLPDIKCDIELSISFMKDGKTLNICDFEEELWQNSLDSQDQGSDVNETFMHLLSSCDRHITINFLQTSGNNMVDTFIKNTAQMLPQAVT